MALPGLFQQSRPIEAPKDGGRSGVGKSETMEERRAMTADERLALVEGRLLNTERILNALDQLLRDPMTSRLVRDNAHFVLRIPATASTDPRIGAGTEGERFDLRTMFGGTPASHVKPIFLGGGALEMNINNAGWIPCTANQVGEFSDDTIWDLRIRVTTTTTSEALIWVGGHIGRTLA